MSSPLAEIFKVFNFIGNPYATADGKSTPVRRFFHLVGILARCNDHDRNHNSNRNCTTTINYFQFFIGKHTTTPLALLFSVKRRSYRLLFSVPAIPIHLRFCIFYALSIFFSSTSIMIHNTKLIPHSIHISTCRCLNDVGFILAAKKTPIIPSAEEIKYNNIKQPLWI